MPTFPRPDGRVRLFIALRSTHCYSGSLSTLAYRSGDPIFSLLPAKVCSLALTGPVASVRCLLSGSGGFVQRDSASNRFPPRARLRKSQIQNLKSHLSTIDLEKVEAGLGFRPYVDLILNPLGIEFWCGGVRAAGGACILVDPTPAHYSQAVGSSLRL
jgi:hypothetical protein